MSATIKMPVTALAPVKPVDGQKLQSLTVAESEIKGAWKVEGLALKRIRDEKLFEAKGYTTFANYYQDELDYHKSTVSLRIKAAETAKRVRVTEQRYNPSQVVYRELSTVAPAKQQSVIDRACEISITNGDSRVMAKHVKNAIQEDAGGYASPVIQASHKWGFTGDIERMNILQRWYDKGVENHDSKFWAVFHSGVLDPADDKPVVYFAEDTISAIRDVENRWQVSRIISDSPNPAIEGLVSEAKLIIDGMNIANDWQGKRVRIRVDILDG